MSRFHVDASPLRESRDFRPLLSAGTVFYVGGVVTYVAVPFQLYHLTGSNLAVGAVGLVELVPLVVFGLYGGALADHVDRRAMLVLTGLAQIVLTAVLLVNATFARPQIWVVDVVAALLSVAQSLQRSSREALIPRVVPHHLLSSAVALSWLGMQVGAVIGPTLGGLLLAGPGAAWAYGVDVAGLVVATALFFAWHQTIPDTMRGRMAGIEMLSYSSARSAARRAAASWPT